jgi:hypothetical protein
MRALDLKSTLVAGLIGAGMLFLVDYFMGAEENSVTSVLLAGAVVGVGVQIGVRLTGIS